MTKMAMVSFRDYASRFRHYFRFSKEEIEACLISTLVMAFIISFNEWGYGTQFDFNIGLINFIRAIFVVGIVLLVQIVSIKAYSLRVGYRAEFKLWWYGLIIGLGLAFLSASLTRGAAKSTIVWFLAPGGIFVHHLAIQRLGWFRYGVNVWNEAGWCLMYGIIGTVGLSVLSKLLLYIFPGSGFLSKLMVVSLWFAFFSMLPIPPLIGSRLFFWSRPTYFFTFGIVIGFIILLQLSIPLWSVFVFSLILGLIVWIFYLWRMAK